MDIDEEKSSHASDDEQQDAGSVDDLLHQIHSCLSQLGSSLQRCMDKVCAYNSTGESCDINKQHMNNHNSLLARVLH